MCKPGALPDPTPEGFFEPILGRAPETWPWTLPSIYAINFATGMGEVIVQSIADPAGEYTEKREQRTNVGCREVIGYWRGEFRIVDVSRYEDAGRAADAAISAFNDLPCRYLLERGTVVKINGAIEPTGEWPERWAFQCLRDLGALCAYLYETALDHGAKMEAHQFRDFLHRAGPPTEQILVYITALEWGKRTLRFHIPTKALAALQEGLNAAKGWLK